jgi:AmmeMemoRadiSam system protein B/AmmeMemoRadiSam system protein A
MRAAVAFLLYLVPAVTAEVHQVPVSANWYPAEPEGLRQALDRAFARRQSAQPQRKKLLALVAPHAALSYSGSVAASAYQRLDHPDNIILLGFSHRRANGGIVAPDVDAYTTPLGRINVNRRAIAEMGIRTLPEGRICDHSIENQLPFVQRAAPGAAVIPLFVGRLSEDELEAAGRKLAARLAQGDVLVASTDLTHYGANYGYEPFPNDSELPERLRTRATEIMERVGSLEVASLDRYLADTRENVCGWAALRLLMTTLRNWNEAVYPVQVDYLASGALTRDYSVSVGYGAMAFYPASAFTIGPEDRQKLLGSARRTLDEYLATGKKRPRPVPGPERSTAVEQRSGVFVTIRKNGRMRGCIGTLVPARPLWDGVADRTLAAATDSRFPPLTAAEEPLSVEVSVLTPLKRLADWRQFRLGQGGLIVLEGRSGTILPQIAEEQRWTRPEQFLSNLSVKAGLDARAYRDPRAVLYVYEAQVFSEGAANGN